VVNIAGDLTWLAEDRGTLLALKQKKPAVEFKIYYEKTSLPENLEPIVEELARNGIRFIPYPREFTPGFQCILIDGGDANEQRVTSTWREGKRLTGQERSQQRFHYKEYTSEHKLVPFAIRGITKLLDSWPKSPVLVGITGVYNVGKTALASALRNSLPQICKTVLFYDPFREPISGVTLQDNFRMMIFQLLESNANPDADVYIFDTTIAECLCYLALRGPEGDHTYQQLAHACAEVMRRFDMIIEVHKDKDDIDCPTTHLTGADRRQIRENLKEFYDRYALVRQKVVLRTDSFENSVEVASAAIRQRVLRVLDSRNKTRI
jgi:hypothetical protein